VLRLVAKQSQNWLFNYHIDWHERTSVERTA
jgi:hypothetical protein